MEAGGWRLTADKPFIAHRKPCNESCGKSGETNRRAYISLKLAFLFLFVDVKNYCISQRIGNRFKNKKISTCEVGNISHIVIFEGVIKSEQPL